jgi:CRISPR-associated protein Cas1
MSIVPHLIADTFGTHIGKYSERLKVTKGNETLIEAPLLHLRMVLVTSRGVSISADALAECSERGIPVFFLSSSGTPYGALYAAGLGGTVLTRREQILAYQDERGKKAAVAFAAGKIQNQSATLRYMAKTRKETAPAAYEALRQSSEEVLDHLAWLDRLEGETADAVRQGILAAEGNAAQVYWSAIREIIPQDYGWKGREGRGATDPVNSLLNYGYGILYGQVECAILLAGLDPYAGFIHTDRPGKPSLVLDLIEEFRQVAVDRLVFGLINRHFTVEQDEKGRLSDETRQNFAQKVLEHLEAGVRHENKSYPLRAVIQMQARKLAAFLRSDLPEYVAFKAGW